MNFTGNYRHGRQVNLARGSTAFQRSSQSILKDASAARQLREQNRKREHAAILIQSFYRGRMAVSEARRDVRDQFVSIIKQFTSISQNPVEYPAYQVISTFAFFFGKCEPVRQDAEFIPAIEKLIGGPANAGSISFGLRFRFCQILFESMEVSCSDSKIFESCLRLLAVIQSNINLETVLEMYSRSLTVISDSAMAVKLIPNIQSAMQNFNSNIAVQAFIKHILSVPNLLLIINEDTEKGGSVPQILDFDTVIVPALANRIDLSMSMPVAEQDNRILWLLANILHIWKHPEGSAVNAFLSIDLMRAISHLLLYLSVGGAKKLAKSMAGKGQIFVDKFIVDNIQILKNRAIVEMAVAPVKSILRQRSQSAMTPEEVSELVSTCGFFVGLLRIWPSKNSQIRYYLYLTPEYTLPLFFRALRASTIFNVITNPPNETYPPIGTLWSPESQQLDSVQEIEQVVQEWEVLGLCLDICWHWLIMTDDDEFFDENQYGLTPSQVRELGMFLKHLVFLIICNSEPTAGVQQGRITVRLGFGDDNDVPLAKTSELTLDKLKNDAVGIIRQLYYRDARRRFLEDEYWLLQGKIDIGGFVQEAVLDEDKVAQYWEEEASGGLPNAVLASDSEEDEDSAREKEDVEMQDASSDARRRLRERLMRTPRLEILQKIPFVLPFSARVDILDKSLALDRQKLGLDREYELRVRRHTATIRRDQMLSDAFEQMNELRGQLKSLIGITFVNEFGDAEAGIDGGGITKEFLVGVCKDGFDPVQGLFLENDERLLYPNPRATSAEALARLEFLGRIIGKAVYQGILVEVSFAQFFLSKWQVPSHNRALFGSGFRNTFDDLWSLDAELYRGLIKLKKFEGDVETVFGLNFTIQDADGRTIDLIRNGSNIPVTSENRIQYIHAVADFKLNRELYRQTSAFLFGMNDLLSPSWLAMFGPHEMQTLVGGAAIPIDIEDWKRNTVLGGFEETDSTITYFWEVIGELGDEDVRAILKFVTSVSRAPLQGFNSLKPPFTIREAGLLEDRLPTASTCVNLLKLPRYTTKQVLRDKLLFAVTAGAGFDLS
ncbi:uncharacterized protein V1516DRAFT_624876 [Lipomyces oligophaga]|uniref:uncharacterized protein n=1 Tax=Lipomyces oligophaga TaxID=45792 RepID=UPI0034CE8E52